jgi:hypothetical protein
MTIQDSHRSELAIRRAIGWLFVGATLATVACSASVADPGPVTDSGVSQPETSTPKDSDPGDAARDVFFNDSSECRACIDSCNPERDACMAEPQCVTLAKCISGCGMDSACITACKTKTISFAYEKYEGCLSTCESACR